MSIQSPKTKGSEEPFENCQLQFFNLIKYTSEPIPEGNHYFPNKLSTFASAIPKRASIASNAGSAGVATASVIC